MICKAGSQSLLGVPHKCWRYHTTIGEQSLPEAAEEQHCKAAGRAAGVVASQVTSASTTEPETTISTRVISCIRGPLTLS